MRTLVSRWADLANAAASEGLPGPRLADVELQPPVPDPSKILAAPINYRDHQVEMNVNAQVDSLGLFLKSPSSLTGPDSTVRLPYSDRRFDQEGELALVIGRTAYQIDPAQASEFVFGYTGLLDITMRGGEDRSTRKSFETFSPMGPWLVTPDEFGNPANTDLRCWVNDDLRQCANTRDLIWSPHKLVWFASWVSHLEPGDIITTGTPAGVGPLQHGDVISLELAGLGRRLEVRVSAEGAIPSLTCGRRP
jgi:2-keto-4-pentenoate hydratase/2-oxohepta-3-ene-1,7-dioic acid hydratase in catechol pathway